MTDKAAQPSAPGDHPPVSARQVLTLEQLAKADPGSATARTLARALAVDRRAGPGALRRLLDILGWDDVSALELVAPNPTIDDAVMEALVTCAVRDRGRRTQGLAIGLHQNPAVPVATLRTVRAGRSASERSRLLTVLLGRPDVNEITLLEAVRSTREAPQLAALDHPAVTRPVVLAALCGRGPRAARAAARHPLADWSMMADTRVGDLRLPAYTITELLPRHSPAHAQPADVGAAPAVPEGARAGVAAVAANMADLAVHAAVLVAVQALVPAATTAAPGRAG